MNGHSVSLLIVVVALVASLNGATLEGPLSDCPDICTFDYRPVCGYDGACYHIYGNECTLKSEICKRKQALGSVEMKLCEEALAKTNPEVVACVIDQPQV